MSVGETQVLIQVLFLFILLNNPWIKVFLPEGPILQLYVAYYTFVSSPVPVEFNLFT